MCVLVNTLQCHDPVDERLRPKGRSTRPSAPCSKHVRLFHAAGAPVCPSRASAPCKPACSMQARLPKASPSVQLHPSAQLQARLLNCRPVCSTAGPSAQLQARLLDCMGPCPILLNYTNLSAQLKPVCSRPLLDAGPPVFSTQRVPVCNKLVRLLHARGAPVSSMGARVYSMQARMCSIQARVLVPCRHARLFRASSRICSVQARVSVPCRRARASAPSKRARLPHAGVCPMQARRARLSHADASAPCNSMREARPFVP